MRHRFERHVLDGVDVRAALLTLVVDLGLLLRRRGHAARALTLQLAFAGAASGRRSVAWSNPPRTRTTCAPSPTSSWTPPASSAAA
ncbi:hypothetical protein [Streptomyces actuosus]|uniref:DinB/UmuC family translesion DNA polymerase n=1 Tax=Streptomyces actuosus TaxID=1885 RepID=UPI0031B9E8AA